MKTLLKTIVFIIAVLLTVELFAQEENVAVVAADKMNVFYIGIDNPVSIAVPGITNDKLIVSIVNGSISGSNGRYIVKAENTSDVVINVSAEIKPGEIKMMGSSTFRVKRVPNPIACLNGNCDPNTTISKSELLKNPVLSVFMQMPFDLKFEIESFKLTYNTDNSLVTEWTSGNLFNQKMIDAVSKIEKGNKIYFEDIKVKGPDGATRMIGSIWFVLSD